MNLELFVLCLIPCIPIPMLAVDLYFVIRHGHRSMFGGGIPYRPRFPPTTDGKPTS